MAFSFLKKKFSGSSNNPPPPPPATKTGQSSTSLSSAIGSKAAAFKGDQSARYQYESASYYRYYSNLEKANRDSNQFGLVTKTRGLPSFSVTDMKVEATINDSVCQTVITQSYDNKLTSPVEAIYKIPLSPSSTVTAFQVEYEGKSLVGKIKEKAKAENKYSDSIASGGQAFLGQKTQDGCFTLSIGNMPPGKKVEVRVTIISETGSHMDSLHYILHKLMFPTGQYNLQIQLNINLSVPIEKVVIDGFDTITPDQTSEDKKSVKYTIKAENGFNKSVIVMVTPEGSELPVSTLEYYNRSVAASFNFYPTLEVSPDEIEQKSEYIFLLDCSGSMSGAPIKQAKSALQIIMRSLTENHKFNIYVFGSSFKKLFPTSMIYNDESLETADQYISEIDANLGGTELLPPIKNILNSEYDPEYPRQLFILTDGEVSDRETLIDFVGRESNSTRVFTLGIGSGVDRELVTGLSKACKGYFELIQENKEMESKVLKLLSIAMEPTISNIKIVFEDLPQGVIATQAPKIIRPVFSGERMILYSLFENLPEDLKSLSLKITGNGPTGSLVSYPMNLDLTSPSVLRGSRSIHQLTALNMINDLVKQETDDSKPNNSDRIVQLGKEYSLVSKYTSFIITVESEQVTTDTMQTVKVNENSKVDLSDPETGSAEEDLSLGYESSEEQEEDDDDYDEDVKVPPPSVYRSSSPGNQFIKADSLSRARKSSNQMIYLDDCEEECEPMDVDNSSEDEVVYSKRKLSPMKDKKMKKKECKEKESSQSSLPARRQLAPSPIKPSSVQADSKSSQAPSIQRSKSTGNLLMDLIQSQKANGSWTKDSLPFSPPNLPTEISSLDLTVFITLIAIAKIENTYPKEQDKWDLVVKKAQKFVKSQLTKLNWSQLSFDELYQKCKSL